VVGIAAVTRGPGEDPSAAEQSVPGSALPSFGSTPDPDPAENSDPGSGTSPGQGTPAERGQATGAGSDPVAGAPGLPAPTAAAPLLESAGDQQAEPGGQSVPASGPEPDGTGQPGNGPGPGPGPGGGPTGSTPKPDPKPTTKPTEKPTDKPTDKPSEEPSPSEPPGPRADVGVTAWQGSENHGRVTVWAKVSGVPSGRQVRMTATASTGDFRDSSSACRRSGRGYVCTATSGRNVFAFFANANSRPTVTFRVSAPEGYTDPSSDNNSASVQVTSGRGSSG